MRRGFPFTTAYHTKFPEYVHARTGLPVAWPRAWVKRFHGPSQAVLAPSPSVLRELRDEGYANVVPWSHGVDVDVFRPGDKMAMWPELPRPIFLYVGRVTVDKNLPAFLSLKLPGSKVVVGDGPSRANYIKRFPETLFHIANGDAELAACYNAANVFVFPSRTDTFGLVMLEALACGVPVAAFPVTGPTDVLGTSGAGVLDEDLHRAAIAALNIPPEHCRSHACRFSWDRVADEFLGYLAPIWGRRMDRKAAE